MVQMLSAVGLSVPETGPRTCGPGAMKGQGGHMGSAAMPAASSDWTAYKSDAWDVRLEAGR
jgi:hypothetical protein